MAPSADPREARVAGSRHPGGCSLVPNLRLSGPPPSRLITATRQLVQAVCAEVLGDLDTGYQVAMAAHELMENLAQHSCGGDMEFEVSLRHGEKQDYICIRTRNRATAQKLADLNDTLNTVEAAADPFETYVQFLHRSSARAGGSGLGFARMRAEGDMTLNHVICGDQVTVFAELPVQSRRTA
jgi:hypothetical protein